MKDKYSRKMVAILLSMFALPSFGQNCTEQQTPEERIVKVKEFLKKMIDLGVFYLSEEGKLEIDDQKLEEKLLMLESEGRLKHSIMGNDAICG